MNNAKSEDIEELVLDVAEYAFLAAENGKNLEDVKQSILDEGVN